MTAPDTPAQNDVLQLLPRLQRYAWVLTADLRQADELVLETLSCASDRQSSPALCPQLRLRLFAVMHRLHRDRVVREPRKAPRVLGAARHVAEARGLPPPATTRDQPGAEGARARFSRLAAEQREVLALVVLEELLYTEIAEVLDVPVATVLSRLHSAREEMRAITAELDAPRQAG